MSNLLEQAQVAAQQGNWSLLNQHLQHLLHREQFSAKTQLSSHQVETDWQPVLTLALDALEWGDFQERWEVAKLIPRLGSIAIAPLIEILQDEEADIELRWFTARILGAFDAPEVVNALVELLKDSESEDLSSMAAEALTKLGASAISALTELLVEEDSRLLAVRSLAQIRRSETIAPLLRVVDDPQVAVRATAIEALSSFHDPQIPPILIRALRDTAAPIRQVAVTGLGFRGDLLGELDLIQHIQPLLWDLNVAVCQQAALALGRLKTEAAAEVLFQALKSAHPSTALQTSILRALGWHGKLNALAYLQQALTLETVTVPQEIVTVIGRVEAPALKSEAAQILINLLESDDPVIQNLAVKQAIAVSLGELGDLKAIPALMQLLADSETGVRLHAIAALKKLAPQLAHHQLKDLAKDETLTPELKQGVALALQEW
jgi:HEAT repeat protein